tara:strand:- start:50 stop:712 length:663 start_codon:yes stop_codon:yes gene_type:complete
MEAIQAKLMSNLQKLSQTLSTLTDAELTLLARELDFFQELNRLGYSDALTSLMDEYDTVAARVFSLAAEKGIRVSVASAQMLELTKELDAITLLGRAKDYSGKLKAELLKGIIAGESGSSIATKLMETVGKELSSANVNMIVNDSFARFSNSATFKAFEDVPDQRYQYMGAWDNKTRDDCVTVLSDPRNDRGFTVGEIGSLPVGFADRGGFNCRHDWILV